MPQPIGTPDLPQIRKEIQHIIINVMGEGDPRSIPDDIPILDLGVGSLALVEGMRQVYDHFGVLVSIRRVIEGQITIGTLALFIEQELNSQQSLKKRAQANSQWKIERQVPLAPSQQHVAFLSRYSNEAGAAFNESVIVHLKGALHGPALHTAIEEVGKRYEALRTALDLDSNALNLGTGEPLELTVTPTASDQIATRLAEIVGRPFEIGKQLFRAELLRLSENEHVLALVGHALVIEPHALRIILEDIAALYRLFALDQEAGLAPLTLQWTDYLALSETDEAREAQRRAETYWKDVITPDMPRLEIPADHPRPSVKRYGGSRVDLKLDSAIHTRLIAVAASENIHPETILLAAYTAFIHRLADTADLVAGVESESLYLDGGAPAIANTRNMLPLRTRFDATRRFKEHLQQEASALVEANAHRHISFYELIQLLQLPRDQSRSPIFTAAFRSQREDTVPVFEGLQSEFIPSPSAGARYDLELIVRAQGADIALTCDYSTELFEAQTIARWLNGLVTFLDAGLQNIDQACGVLPMMTAPERELLIHEWNKTSKEIPAQTVFDLINEQVQARREVTAIQFADTSLSYGQLIERVEQIASTLNQNGVQQGDRVGILMKRSLDLIPAILATWRLGALYVPMDVGFPKKRIAYMLSDAQVQTVITNHDLIGLLSEALTLNTVFVEDIQSQVDSGLAQIKPAAESDSAYIMYTSGSTGKPKGVEIKHRALVNCLLALKEYQEFAPESSMLALTTISFDVSTNELFTPLISGGCVEIGEDGLVADGLQIAARMAGHQPSHMQLTATTWKSVLTAGWNGDQNIILVSCGEALSRELAEQLLPKCKALWNFYGPTETTVYSSAHLVESAPGEPMQIGRPLPNTQMYILDKQYQPVPIGAVGDLYIAGDGLAVGYWQRPELTHERFIPNPFRAGERMYQTGDLARALPDGNIICLGRVDDQVKIHGVRVELGEVESALRSLEGIRDAVVVSWKDSRDDTQLVAHVILHEKDSVNTSQLRAQLRERLPDAMVPPYILFTETFPQTANGKVQRAALPAPVLTSPAGSEAKGEAPSTSTEKQVAQAWASVLGIEASLIHREADFMDLGGHSLLMTALMIEVRKSFEVSFSLREFFGASTLKKFAALIDERQQDSSKSNGSASAASTRTSEWARQRMAYLSREADLPRYLAPARGMTYRPVTDIQNVLLTGATGFLGAYTVAEILNTTRAHIYCLVRPRRGESSKERIERQMKRYQVWAEGDAWQSAWDERLHVVDGDVTLPRLGMKDSEYESLARDIDAIFHGAAHVNFIYPYEALRATNVLGVHEIIQFAFHARIKVVHHLSTAAIWPMGSQYTYYEKDPIDHNGLLNLGYDEAKWVGEKCLLNAEERGLPVARYRPGEVGGDSVTGRCVTDHFIIACFKGFLQFGVFPDLDIEVDVAPVDYVAKAMVYLAFHRNVVGRAFHLTNPSRRRMKDGMAYLRQIGYRFEELPFVELRDRLVSSRDFANNALFAYQAALEDMDDISMQLPIYDTRETDRELAGSGIKCAPADEKLFGSYLRYLQNVGFIPQPEEMQASL